MNKTFTDGELAVFFNNKASAAREELYRKAWDIAAAECGSGVLLRGIVEFSSYCRNSCRYCGLNCRTKNAVRYRMSSDQILSAVKKIYEHGIKTVVLQSGEDPELSAPWLADVIRSIKDNFDIAVTISVGEWPGSSYKLWKEAGADRFLLKFETSDRRLYDVLHPGMSFKKRLACLEELAELGYQTGSGIIAGLPGQSPEILVKDIRLMEKLKLDMISIGPFIPHPGTDLAGYPPGRVQAVCDLIALTRCITRNAHMPATSALASAVPDLRHKALLSGANVIMPNFTPPWCSELYDIYPHCNRNQETRTAGSVEAAEHEIRKAGRTPDYSKGDSPKSQFMKGYTE